jgi:hypothetical protein
LPQQSPLPSSCCWRKCEILKTKIFRADRSCGRRESWCQTVFTLFRVGQRYHLSNFFYCEISCNRGWFPDELHLYTKRNIF